LGLQFCECRSSVGSVQPDPVPMQFVRPILRSFQPSRSLLITCTFLPKTFCYRYAIKVQRNTFSYLKII